MHSTIVVGTDGSETASQAVSSAIELARDQGAVLHVVSAYRAGGSGSVSIPLAGAAAGDTGIGSALSKKFSEEAVAQTAASLTDLRVETHVAEGDPADVIVKVAEDVGADLIVVGSKGMHRRVLGSVPNSVAHHAPCDVLIVKTT